MVEESVRRFAQENFSEKYFPVLHGEIDKIQPLTVVVKQHRSIFKRPYARYEMTILAGMEKYLSERPEESADAAFVESVKSKISEETFLTKQDIDMGGSSLEGNVGIAGFMEGTINLKDDEGVLHLGKLSQRYIDDPDLRGILANAELDTNKMKAFEDQKLLLITSVIYSDKFELQGERMQEAEGGAEVQENPIFKIFKPSKIHYKGTYIPPEMATRTSKGPFLFKCNHVEYNDEMNRLEIRKGEFVGKTIQVHRDAGHSQEEDYEYNSTLVDLDTDKTDSSVLILIKTDNDKLDIIKKEVLQPQTSRAGRKAHVSKYLNWFADALISDENKLLLDEPLTSEDCQFLRAVYLPCSLNSTVLDLTSLKKKEIQAYAIVFKKLHDLPEEKLNDLKMTWLDLNVKSKETCRMAYQSENNV